MIERHQEFAHDPENGVIGDCMRACVASVLELPLKAVPHFAKIEGDAWLKSYSRFMFKHGWGIYTKMGQMDRHPDIQSDENEYYFAIGPSPRHVNVSHMVVCRNKAVVHDPHPSGVGLEVIEAFEILFKIDPDGGSKDQ